MAVARPLAGPALALWRPATGHGRASALRNAVRCGALAALWRGDHPAGQGGDAAPVTLESLSMNTLRRLVVPTLALLSLSACDPQQAVDDLGRRTAETVVKPIVDDGMTEPQAAGVTRCIVQNASADEIRVLVRDVANSAGTATVAAVATIAARPETLSCIRAAGLPAPVL